MRAVFSNYNFTPDWILDYDFDYIIYDRSDSKRLNNFPPNRVIYVKNLGSDIFDKLTWIIDNYDRLPDVVMLAKSNLFKYISLDEFDEALEKGENKEFVPLLTQKHRTYSDEQGEVCFYKDGIYYERNNKWFLNPHPAQSEELFYILGLSQLDYIPFAPGSSYILPKQNILKHSKRFYEKLRGYLDYTIYPGEAMILERGLFLLWR